jgi:hypothetical protein
MATVKVTITLEAEALKSIRELVKARKAASVSGFVQHAVTIALQDASGWGAMLAEALAQTGGPLTAKERAWVDGLLSRASRRGARRRRAA